jgi:hypothetical protein
MEPLGVDRLGVDDARQEPLARRVAILQLGRHGRHGRKPSMGSTALGL